MVSTNIAMQIWNYLGVSCLYRNTGHVNKSPSFTKKGPGRKHQQGKKQGV